MQISIGGYSFHGLLESGQQDIFKYITDCRELGATQLDPWNAQLAPIRGADDVIRAGADPEHATLSAQDDSYLLEVRKAAVAAGLPFGCIAVDGAHIYDEDPAVRHMNRALAYRWLDVAKLLGAKQVRIDSGGPEVLTDDVFEIIREGYRDLIVRAGAMGIEILIENHWGPSKFPDNVVRMLENIEGLGLLFDSHNWADGEQERGWRLCAQYACSSHMKAFEFDENGEDLSGNLPVVIHCLLDAGYNGCWGIETCPIDGDEYGAVRKVVAMLRRYVGQ